MWIASRWFDPTRIPGKAHCEFSYGRWTYHRPPFAVIVGSSIRDLAERVLIPSA